MDISLGMNGKTPYDIAPVLKSSSCHGEAYQGGDKAQMPTYNTEKGEVCYNSDG